VVFEQEAIANTELCATVPRTRCCLLELLSQLSPFSLHLTLVVSYKTQSSLNVMHQLPALGLQATLLAKMQIHTSDTMVDPKGDEAQLTSSGNGECQVIRPNLLRHT